MPFTTRGFKLMFDWSFRAATRPSNFYMALVTSATTPTDATKTMSQLTQITAGNGYTNGGYQLSPNSTDFNALVEDDTNHWTRLGIKNITWTASGGNIPASGNQARHIVLTTDEGTIGNRQIIWYQSLGADRLIASGTPLTIQGIEGRIQGGSQIKSIQRGSITMTGTSTSGQAAINLVNTAKAVLELLGYNSNSTSDTTITALLPRLSLVNATSVQATRGVTTSLVGTLTVQFQVTEYY